MGLKGDLDSISLADIFQTLSMTGQEGTLFVRNSAVTKYIYFAPDGVTMLTTGEKKKKLGDLLVGLGKISPDDLKDALFQQKQTGALLGETLRQMGLVSDQDIENAVRFQIEEEIYDLFSWDNASFEFKEGATPEEVADDVDQVVTRLRFNVNSLIMEAARRADEWEKIEQYIPSTSAIFRLEGAAQVGEYTDQEQLILEAVDGDRSVDDVVTLTHVPRFDVCRFIARLVEEGKARRAPTEWLLERGDAHRAAGNNERALAFYRQACEGKLRKKSEQADARIRLAEVLEALGEKKDAGEQYKILADIRAEEHDVEGAMTYWQKVIDLNPLDLENKERLISVYLENRTHLDPDRSDVIRTVEYSLFKNGKALAMAFSYAGQVQKAKEVLERLIDITPSNVELRKALVNIHLEHDEKAEAVEEFERIASYQVSQRNFDDVRAIYKSILKLAPDRADIKRKLTMLEQQQAGPDSAEGAAGGGGRPKKRRGWVAVALLVAAAAGGWCFYALKYAPEQAADELAAAEKLVQEIGGTPTDTPFDQLEPTYDKAIKIYRAVADAWMFTPVASAAAASADKLVVQKQTRKRQWSQNVKAGRETLELVVTNLLEEARSQSWDTTTVDEHITKAIRDYENREGTGDLLKRLREALANIQQFRTTNLADLKRAAELAKAGAADPSKLAESWAISLRLLQDDEVKTKLKSTVWDKVRFAFRIETLPDGAWVKFDDVQQKGTTPLTRLDGTFDQRIDIVAGKRGYHQATLRYTVGDPKPGPVVRFELILSQWYDQPFNTRGQQLPRTISWPWRFAGDAFVSVGQGGRVVQLAPLDRGLQATRPPLEIKKTDNPMKNGPTGTPAVAQDVLVAGREDGHVLKWNRTDPGLAEERWDYALFQPAADDDPMFKNEVPVGSPVIDAARGQVYVASTMGRIHAISLSEGSRVWATGLLGREQDPVALTQPVLVGEMVVAGTAKGALVGVHYKDQEFHQRAFNVVTVPGGRYLYPPVAAPASNLVVIASSEGQRSRLQAFDLGRPRENGQLARLWRPVQLHGNPVGSPVLVLGKARPVALVAVEGAPGKEGRIVSTTLDAGDNLWGNKLADGLKVGDGVRQPAVLQRSQDTRLYVAAGDRFYVFDLKTGAEAHQLKFGQGEQAVLPPCVDQEGHVLLTFRKGGIPILYVVRE